MADGYVFGIDYPVFIEAIPRSFRLFGIRFSNFTEGWKTASLWRRLVYRIVMLSPNVLLSEPRDWLPRRNG